MKINESIHPIIIRIIGISLFLYLGLKILDYIILFMQYPLIVGPRMSFYMSMVLYPLFFIYLFLIYHSLGLYRYKENSRKLLCIGLLLLLFISIFNDLKLYIDSLLHPVSTLMYEPMEIHKQSSAPTYIKFLIILIFSSIMVHYFRRKDISNWILLSIGFIITISFFYIFKWLDLFFWTVLSTGPATGTVFKISKIPHLLGNILFVLIVFYLSRPIIKNYFIPPTDSGGVLEPTPENSTFSS